MNIIAIIVVIVVIIFSLLRDRRSVADQPRGPQVIDITGGYPGQVYYYGSRTNSPEIKPYPLYPDYQKVILASANYNVAALYCATDNAYYHIIMNSRCVPYSIEMFPGAFKIYDITGYVHHVPTDTFRPGPNPFTEYTSFVPVKSIKCDKINVRKYLEQSKTKLISFKEALNEWRKTEKKIIVTMSNLKKIKRVYVPLDEYAPMPKINAIRFEPNNPAKLNQILDQEQSPVDLYGRLILYDPMQIVEFPGIEIILLERKDKSYVDIPIEDHEEYIKARKKIYKGIGKIEYY